MRYRLFSLMLVPMILSLSGCLNTTRIDPLSLRYYRRNLVLEKDNTLRIEHYDTTGVSLKEIKLSELRKELVKRQILAKDPIALHIHRYVSPCDFDTVVMRLKEEGYFFIEFVRFRDPDVPTFRK